MPSEASAVAEPSASTNDFDVDPAAFGLNADGSEPSASQETTTAGATAGSSAGQGQPAVDTGSQAQTAAAAPAAAGAEVQTAADAQAQAQAQTQYLQEVARQLGYQGQAYETDAAFLQHLLQTQAEHQRAQAELQQFRQVQPYLSEFAKWQQQQYAQQQQQAQVDPWGRPEFDPQWETFLEPDENGGVRLRKGVAADPALPQKYLQSQQFLAQRLRDFAFNPERAFAPLVQQVAQQVYQGLQQEFSQRDQQAFARQLVDSNADWIYANKQTRELSPKGRRLTQLITELEAQGIRDPQMQSRFAMQQLRLEELEAARQQQAAPPAAQQANAAAKQQFLQQTNGSVRRPNSSAAGAGPAAGPTSFADLIRQEIGDQTVEFDPRFGG